jgi:hypothetical protein
MTLTRDWRKSSRSQNAMDCVEIAHLLDAVRDSKNGTVLAVDVRGLISAVKGGQFADLGR